MTRRGALNHLHRHLHGAQTPEQPTGNRSSALGRWARTAAAAVLCGGLFAAPVESLAQQNGPDSTFASEYHLLAPVTEEYVRDLLFSRHDSVGDGWPRSIEFKGRDDINQYVNRLPRHFKVYLDERIYGSEAENAERDAWLGEFFRFFVQTTGTKIDVVIFRDISDVEVRLTSDDHSLEDIWDGLQHDYGRLLEKEDRVMSMFMSPKSDLEKKGCFYVGLVGDFHEILDGFLVIDENLEWDRWRNCFIGGMFRVAGFLGGRISYPSTLRSGGGAVQVEMNGYEVDTLEYLYSNDVHQGMPIGNAMEALRKRLGLTD